ncbi:YihY/virulence factor BrkB family protein [Chitinophagaceae bacterium MMS25-I14]
MKAPLTFKGVWEVLKNTFKGFSDDKVTKLSGSLAYSTVFSMGPLLILIISLCSIVWGREAVEGKIYSQLSAFMGNDTAIQLQTIIQNAALGGKKTMAAIVGGVTLLLGATAIFGEIQDSVNTIWGLKPKPKKGWLKMLQNRFLSFSIIVSLGFLLLVSLAVTTLIDGFSTRLQSHFPDVTIVLFYILNQLITLAIITTIFSVIFRVLPDARIRWRDILGGSVVTALLFMIGKFLISFYISKSNVGSTFGAAGALVVLMLWTYYSSIILYFGAEFTKAYAVKYGAPIMPNSYAVTTKSVEVETNGATVQENEAGAKK